MTNQIPLLLNSHRKRKSLWPLWLSRWSGRRWLISPNPSCRWVFPSWSRSPKSLNRGCSPSWTRWPMRSGCASCLPISAWAWCSSWSAASARTNGTPRSPKRAPTVRQATSPPMSLASSTLSGSPWARSCSRAVTSPQGKTRFHQTVSSGNYETHSEVVNFFPSLSVLTHCMTSRPVIFTVRRHVRMDCVCVSDGDHANEFVLRSVRALCTETPRLSIPLRPSSLFQTCLIDANGSWTNLDTPLWRAVACDRVDEEEITH